MMTDSPTTPTMPRGISHSGVSTWQQCPRRWWFNKIDRLPSPPSAASFKGVFVHRVAEFAEVERTTLDQLQELCKRLWDGDERILEERAKLALPTADEKRLKSEAWPHCLAVRAEVERRGAAEAVEYVVKADLGGVPFYGEIDRIESVPGDGARDIFGPLDANEVIVVDWKTGKAPDLESRFPKTRVEAVQKLDQLVLYAAALKAQDGLSALSCDYVHTGTGQTVRVEPTEARTEQAIGRLVDVWAEVGHTIQRGSVEPSPSPLCGWCPYLDRCPEGRAAVERRVDKCRRDGKSLGDEAIKLGIGAAPDDVPPLFEPDTAEKEKKPPRWDYSNVAGFRPEFAEWLGRHHAPDSKLVQILTRPKPTRKAV